MKNILKTRLPTSAKFRRRYGDRIMLNSNPGFCAGTIKVETSLKAEGKVNCVSIMLTDSVGYVFASNPVPCKTNTVCAKSVLREKSADEFIRGARTRGEFSVNVLQKYEPDCAGMRHLGEAVAPQQSPNILQNASVPR